MKGTLNVWDILFKQTNPTLTMQVSSFTSRSVASPAGQVVMPITVRPPLPINLMPCTFYCFSGHYIEKWLYTLVFFWTEEDSYDTYSIYQLYVTSYTSGEWILVTIPLGYDLTSLKPSCIHTNKEMNSITNESWTLILPSSQVCDESLHSVRSHDQGKLLATGSHSGNITLLELSDFLSVIQPNEKQNITTVSEHKDCVIMLDLQVLLELKANLNSLVPYLSFLAVRNRRLD